MKPGSRNAAIITAAGALMAIFVFILSACRQPAANAPSDNGDAKALKLQIDRDGFYRLTLDGLRGAGLQIESIGPTNLSLSQNGKDISYWIDGDTLVFYGQAPDSRYAPYRTYVLTTGQPGREMATVAAAESDGPALISIPQTLWLEENRLYDSRARYDEGDDSLAAEPWYWETIQVESQLPINLELDQIDSSQPAILSLKLWGATHNDSIEYDHDLDLMVNGQRVDTIRWDGESHYTSQSTVPAGLLKPGQNEIVLDNSVPGATQIDIMRLDRLSLTYETPPEAVQDKIFVAGTTGQLTMGGFSNQPELFDITVPGQPIRLDEWTYEDGRIHTGIAEGQILAAVGPQAYLTPVGLEPLRTSIWSDSSHQADLIIITTDNLAPELAPLVRARQEQGLSVAMVPVAEVYDMFGYGQPIPSAITEFLRHASENWADPKPRYLLIVGEATYDYRGYLDGGPRNLIPAPIVAVNYSGETVSDARLADLDNNGQPELAVGRWPVDSPEEVASLVKRTLAYEQETASDRVIFTADGTSSEFSSLSDLLLSSSEFDNEVVDRLYGVSADQVIGAWNDGSWLISYVGHGSLDRWGKDDVFTLDAVSRLDGDRAVPIVLQFTCLTGFFAHPELDSISEVMLRHENGPVLLVAATSLTLSSSQQPFGTNLLRALQDPSVVRIGDALQQAKLELDVSSESLREISDTFGLIGDPSALMARPSGDTIR